MMSHFVFLYLRMSRSRRDRSDGPPVALADIMSAAFHTDNDGSAVRIEHISCNNPLSSMAGARGGGERRSGRAGLARDATNASNFSRAISAHAARAASRASAIAASVG